MRPRRGNEHGCEAKETERSRITLRARYTIGGDGQPKITSTLAIAWAFRRSQYVPYTTIFHRQHYIADHDVRPSSELMDVIEHAP